MNRGSLMYQVSKNIQNLYRKEKRRTKQLQAYIRLLEDDLSYAGTPAGFSSKEWDDQRNKLRTKLEKLGDLDNVYICHSKRYWQIERINQW